MRVKLGEELTLMKIQALHHTGSRASLQQALLLIQGSLAYLLVLVEVLTSLFHVLVSGSAACLFLAPVILTVSSYPLAYPSFVLHRIR